MAPDAADGEVMKNVLRFACAFVSWCPVVTSVVGVKYGRVFAAYLLFVPPPPLATVTTLVGSLQGGGGGVPRVVSSNWMEQVLGVCRISAELPTQVPVIAGVGAGMPV